ncbi:MAG: alpha-2-macroglobulin family protein [Thermoguttaceae bacterium]
MTATLGTDDPSQTDPVPICEEMVAENALYLDAYNLLSPWIVNPQTTSPSLARGIELCRICLDMLNRSNDADAFLEGTVKAHPNDWQVYGAVAQQYASLPSWGVMRGGQFVRGSSSGEMAYADRRDRVRALQLYAKGMELLENAPDRQSIDPALVFEFYSGFARVCCEVKNQWAMLQELTRLEELPDYDRSIPSAWQTDSYAPVDEEGNPIFYGVAETFESAKNDGERWRFLLEQAANSGAANAADARILYANFLMEQFGPETLGRYRFFPGPVFPGPETDGDDSLAAIGSLTTLSDNETIARLASGIKRFAFPEGQNPLWTLRWLMDDDSIGLGSQIRAASDLGRAYMNRRQYVKAEEVFRKLADLEFKAALPDDECSAKKQLDTLTGNYGAFIPTESKVAGTEASFLWKFRNGTKARFRVQEIDVRRFLDDAMAYLNDMSRNPPAEWDINKIRLEDIGWKLLNDPDVARRYLSSDVADWSVDLQPAPDHCDSRITIDFPLDKPGAYLLRGKMENGNSDAIVIWLSDTMILKKRVRGNTFWYVGDAKTGAPIPEADLRFFGYSVERMVAGRNSAASGFRNGKWHVRTKESQQRVNQDGWLMTDQTDLNPRYRWLVEAFTTTEEGAGRFAYYGFDNIWSERMVQPPFEQTRACFLSDRPIYRPNDTVHFRFQAATSRYDLPETWTWQGVPARLVIAGPGGKEIVSKEVVLDETGGWEDTLETDESFHLGTYTFRLDLLHVRSKGNKSPSAASPKWRPIGFGNISLEEYRKPEFEVKVDTPEEPVTLGEKFSVKVRADYYFGSPVTRARVHWRVTRSRADAPWYPVARWDWLYGNGYGWLMPEAPWFPDWSRWAIGCLPPLRRHVWSESDEVVASGEAEIGEDGTIEIPIDTSLAAQLYPSQNQSYEVVAEVTDSSRRMVTGSGKIFVVKEPFKVVTWAQRGFYVPQQQIDYSVAVRRADGRPVSGRGSVTVNRVRMVKDPDRPGNFNAQETTVLTEEISIDSGGQGLLSFTLPEAGLYRFSCVVNDGNGNESVGGSLITVTGPDGTLPDQNTCSNPIDIVLEQPEYRPGEKARLRISSSVPNASVLLFVRNEGSNAGEPRLLRLRSGSTFYEIDITDADIPNIWVEAVSVQEGHFYNVAKNIPIPPVSRVIDVQVSPDKDSYKPGERAKMTVHLTDPDGKPVTGVITVAVYDRSLDGIVAQSLPDLKKFFWDWTRSYSPSQQHTLEQVFRPIDFPRKSTMQSLGIFEDFAEEFLTEGGVTVRENSVSRGVMALSDNIRGRREFAGAGSPAASMLAAVDEAKSADQDILVENTSAEPAPVEPEIRSEFADTALWIGQVRTDENGVAKLSFDMPENITSWKMHVWAFAPGTRVGEGSAEAVTRKDLILRMQRPRFLTQTDTILLSAVLHNYTDSDKKAEVALNVDPDSEDATVIKLCDATQAVQEVDLPAGGDVRVDWQVDAIAAGKASLVMTAQTECESDGVRESFPVYLHGIRKQESVSAVIPSAPEGDTAPREYTFDVTVPTERIPEQTSLTVRFSPTLAGAMLDAIPYLTDYPYGCTEQTLNRFLPTVLIRKLLSNSGIDLAELETRRSNLNPQELGDAQTRRQGWQRQQLNIFGEPIDENDSTRDPVFSSSEVTKRVEEGIARLKELQCSDGGWGWFGGWGEHSDPHLTALVTDGLFLAGEGGVDVPEQILRGGIEWLRKYLFNEHALLAAGRKAANDPNYEAPHNAKTVASANDVLAYFTLVSWDATRRGEEEERMMSEMDEFIFASRTSLTPYSLALYGITQTLLSKHSPVNQERCEMVERMLRQYLRTDETNQTAWLDLQAAGVGPLRWFWYGNAIETQAAFLRFLLRVAPEDPACPGLVKWLLNNRKNAGYWESTRDTAYCLIALWEYLQDTHEAMQTGTVEILVDGQSLRVETITPERMFEIDNTLILAGDELEAGSHEVKIRYTGTGPLYCNAYLTHFTMEPFIRKAGVETEITRTYWKLTEDEPAMETAVGSRGELAQKRVRKFKRELMEDGAVVKSGDLIEVELNLISRNDYESILIEDRKPAGFEPVDPVSGYDGGPLGAYVEFRDARVLFFVHRLAQGTHTQTYRLRAESPGTVCALPATVEGMYAPELRGNSDEFQTTVTD